MNIFNSIRRNWLLVTLCLLLFTISCSHNFGNHPLSWWNVCWIFVPIALAIFAADNDWLILRPVRWWLWPCHKTYIEEKFKKLSNPMVYPAMIWIEFHGQKAFILAGLKGVQDGLFGQGEKTKGALVATMEAAAKEHKGHSPNCDCAHT